MPENQPIKFLLVDDLEANLIALEGLLKRDGLELLKARSGKEALELLLIHEIALAFVDIQMPEMTGFELAEIMRSTERTRGTPIIFLTAGTVDHDRRIRGYETGAIDFLPKPINPTILLNKAAVFFELALQRQGLQESEARLRETNDKLEWTNAELARSARSKDEFLAMLAHELRNPLAPMLTGMDVLQRSPEDPGAVAKIAGMMKRQIDQMAHLIDDLLDVSRINNGKIELQVSAVTIDAVLQQAVESVQPLIDSAGHLLTIEGDGKNLVIDADRHRLTQVVSNLLSNAAKYTPPGGKIILGLGQTAGKSVRISVRDNGKGISPEHQARIFDLFDQGASGPKDGLGIGLTLVKSLVEMHGGTISVESSGEGKGSEFTVVLPGLKMSETIATKTMQTTADVGKMQILVADDGKTTADILGMFFRMEGMDCEVVYDGAQAVEAAGRLCPQLACFDLGMPVMDGYEAARNVKQLCPDTYLVALSGWGTDEDRRKTSEAGFDEHLVKPVSPDDLRKLLSRVSSRPGALVGHG